MFVTQMQLERGKFLEVDCAGISRAPTEPEGRALPPLISGIRRSSVTSGYVYGDHCETINHLWVDEYKWKYRIEIWYMHIDIYDVLVDYFIMLKLFQF